MRIRRVLIAILVATALLYLGDDLSVRLRIPPSRDPYGYVTVDRLDAIAEKNGRTEYVPEEPAVETCIHALFPHMGYVPCWYLRRHTEQRVNY